MASEHPLSGLMFKQDEYFQLRDETDLARTRELQKEMMWTDCGESEDFVSLHILNGMPTLPTILLLMLLLLQKLLLRPQASSARSELCIPYQPFHPCCYYYTATTAVHLHLLYSLDPYHLASGLCPTVIVELAERHVA